MCISGGYIPFSLLFICFLCVFLYFELIRTRVSSITHDLWVKLDWLRTPSHDKESQQDLLNIIKAIAMCILKRPQQFDKLFLLHKCYCSQSSFTHKSCVIEETLVLINSVSLLVTMCYYLIYFVTLILTLWRSLSLLDVL
jgi:hypothetical protein